MQNFRYHSIIRKTSIAIMIASYSTSTTLILILLYNTCNQYYAFTFPPCPQFSFSRNRHRKPKGYACARHKIVLDASDNNASDQDDDGLPEIPCLPPIGESSFNGEPAMDSEMIRLDGTSHDVNHVGTEKFELQYTCKVCETRNSHRVSRMAYRNGIVITVCKGCMSKHLIADNLGWTKYIGGFDGDTNIEGRL